MKNNGKNIKYKFLFNESASSEIKITIFNKLFVKGEKFWIIFKLQNNIPEINIDKINNPKIEWVNPLWLEKKNIVPIKVIMIPK